MRRKAFATAIAGLLILGGLNFTGCTENQRARNFGGTTTVKLPAGRKLVNATWKDEDLWYLHRPMRADETAEVHIFEEDSSFGVAEGKVIFEESGQPTK